MMYLYLDNKNNVFLFIHQLFLINQEVYIQLDYNNNKYLLSLLYVLGKLTN